MEKKWKWQGTWNCEFSPTGKELRFWCPSLLRGNMTTIKALLMFSFSVATMWNYKLHTRAARHLAHCCATGCSLSDTSRCRSEKHFGSVFVNHLIRFLLLTEKSPLLKHQTGISSASNIDRDGEKRRRASVVWHEAEDYTEEGHLCVCVCVCVREREKDSFLLYLADDMSF